MIGVVPPFTVDNILANAVPLCSRDSVFFSIDRKPIKDVVRPYVFIYDSIPAVDWVSINSCMAALGRGGLLVSIVGAIGGKITGLTTVVVGTPLK
jgi:hypothetical protein